MLDIAGGVNGGKLTLFTMHGGDNQLWRFEDGCLVSKMGLVADVKAGNRGEGATVIASSWHGNINQKWRLRGSLIESRMTGMVLGLKDGEHGSGAEVVTRSRGGNNIRWELHTISFNENNSTLII